MSHRPLKSTDKRRLYGHKHAGGDSETGEGKPLASLFNDRRKHPNGKGKRAS